MKTQHANPEEAICIAKYCGEQHILGIHSNTFPLTDEPYDQPANRFNTAAATLSSTGVSGQAFTAGDVRTLPPAVNSFSLICDGANVCDNGEASAIGKETRAE